MQSTSSLKLGDSDQGDLYIDLTEDSSVFTGKNVMDTSFMSEGRGRTEKELENLTDVVTSSFTSSNPYTTGSSEARIYGCHVAENSIPATSDIEPVCFRACDDGYKTKDYNECEHSLWKFLNGNLEKENSVESRKAILIVGDKSEIPDFVFEKIQRNGARIVYIFVRRKQNCINQEFWKVVTLESEKAGNGRLGMVVIFIILLFLIAFFFLLSRRKQ